MLNTIRRRQHRSLVAMLLALAIPIAIATGGSASAASRQRTAGARRAGLTGGAASLLAPPVQPTPLTVAPPEAFGFLGRTSPSISPRAATLRVSAAAARSASAADSTSGIVLDSTLVPAKAVPYESGNFTITPSLGRQSGGNLFYSFNSFVLGTGQTADFTGTPTKPVQYVLVRVTGGQTTTIDGTLECTYPNADFFFINPAGITFTANASLNLLSGLAVTTADYIGFSDNTRFAATDAMAGGALPADSPIAFGFLSNAAPAGITVDGAMLQMMSAKPIVAVAGSVSLDGGMLSTPGSAISIATLGPGGQASFDPASSTLGPIAAPAGAVMMSDAATIATDGPAAGAFSLQCGSLSMTGGSLITAVTNNAGMGRDLRVSVAGDAALTGSSAGNDSGIYSESNTTATGAAGRIVFSSASLELTDGAAISSSTLGAGKAGALTMRVSGLATFSGTDAQGDDSGVYAYSDSNGAGGQAGRIDFRAGSLQLLGGAEISSATNGLGRGGDVAVDVSGAALISGAALGSGADASDSDSGIFADTYSATAGGNAGRIDFTAGSLQVLGGAEISSQTNGLGRGGDVVVDVTGLMLLSGVDSSESDSGIYADTNSPAAGGKAGHVEVTAGSLQVSAGAVITSETDGLGKGGDVSVSVPGLALLSGVDAFDSPSGIFANTNSGSADGNAGRIDFHAGSLQLLGGAEISSSTTGLGKGGDVAVDVAGQAVVSGTDGQDSDSGVFSDSNVDGAGGNAGRIDFRAGSLQLLGGAEISSSTYGLGRGGDIAVDVPGAALISGASSTDSDSGIFADTYSAVAGGNAGRIGFTAGSLQLMGGAEITSQTDGLGNGGDVSVSVSGLALLWGGDATGSPSGIFANTNSDVAGGNAGKIRVGVRSLQVLAGGEISSTTFGKGRGGDVAVNVSGQTILSGTDSAGDNSGIFANTGSAGAGGDAGEGDAGKVDFNSGSLQILDGGEISSQAFGLGNGGDIAVTVRGQALVSGTDAQNSNSGIYANTNSTGQGGDGGRIDFRAGDLQVSSGAEIASSTAGGGNGGDVRISIDSLHLSGQSSIESSSTGSGDAGAVHIGALNRILLSDGSTVAASSVLSNAGDVRLDAGRGIDLQDCTVSGQAAQSGGDLEIISEKDIALTDSNVTAAAGANGGNIKFSSLQYIRLTGSDVQSDSTTANGGNISLDPLKLSFTNGSYLDANGGHNGGKINISADMRTGVYTKGPLKDVTATGGTGVSGSIIAVPEQFEFIGGLIKFTANPLPPQARLEESCALLLQGNDLSTFTIGGLGTEPVEPGTWVPTIQLSHPSKPQPAATQPSSGR